MARLAGHGGNVYIGDRVIDNCDDIWDEFGDPELANKTLGIDSIQSKITAASASRDQGPDPVEYIYGLCRESKTSLADWENVQGAWHKYMTQELLPAIEKHTEVFPRVSRA